MNDIAMLGVDSAKWIESCEQEKLHLSGAIQPHGALFVVDSQGDITHVSANITDFYQTAECVDAPAWLGGPAPAGRRTGPTAEPDWRMRRAHRRAGCGV